MDGVDGVPDNATEIERFLESDVLDGVELEAVEARALQDYVNERHQTLLGPQSNYFVLGSHDPPFKYRLERVLDRLNRRQNAYAFLLINREDPDVSTELPVEKIKFYLHALYSDGIVLVVEHNEGGTLVEWGRVDRPPLTKRTCLLFRGLEQRFDGPIGSTEAAYGRAIESNYAHLQIDDELEDIAERVASLDRGISEGDLEMRLQNQFGDRRTISYSGVIVSGASQFRRLDQIDGWTLEYELYEAVEEIP